MYRFRDVLRHFARDSRAAEVTELAIVLSLIVVAAIVAITAIGLAVQQYFSSVVTPLP
jgi:Flp pilus assembly pilin Flp